MAFGSKTSRVTHFELVESVFKDRTSTRLLSRIKPHKGPLNGGVVAEDRGGEGAREAAVPALGVLAA